jgi:hypothetical protein
MRHSWCGDLHSGSVKRRMNAHSVLPIELPTFIAHRPWLIADRSSLIGRRSTIAALALAQCKGATAVSGVDDPRRR